ncbi:MAG TPA: glycosyltransferase family A protein [Chitinophagaceae bacterium]|nr:glycosyltransferase family A protein [Chitinophagaceae bacterium]
MAKYSIILPVRNGGEYIKECIGSILAQTLTDFNLHILENYSTDGTTEWIEALNDERIIIIPAEKPLSMQENWGRILGIRKNEFMTMIGADDILDTNYFEIMNALVEKYPGAGLYQSHYRFINSQGKVIRDCKPMKEIETAREFLESICNNNISIMGTGFMMRSSDYNALGGIPMYPDLLFADFELWLELTRKSFKATASEKVFSYRVHPESTTSSSSYSKYAAGFNRLMMYFKKLKQTDSTVSEYITNNFTQFINYYCQGSAHKLLRIPVSKRDGVMVNDVLDNYKAFADELIPGNNYEPTKTFSIRIAKMIDSNLITRNLFLLFKKIYSKPIYT